MAALPPIRFNLQTPDVVKFGISPEVGQAVLACPTSEAPGKLREGET